MSMLKWRAMPSCGMQEVNTYCGGGRRDSIGTLVLMILGSQREELCGWFQPVVSTTGHTGGLNIGRGPVSTIESQETPLKKLQI